TLRHPSLREKEAVSKVFDMSAGTLVGYYQLYNTDDAQLRSFTLVVNSHFNWLFYPLGNIPNSCIGIFVSYICWTLHTREFARDKRIKKIWRLPKVDRT